MSLPIRTTISDVEAFCGYLLAKPTGATTSEAKAVVDRKVLDGRKLSAYKFWGLIEDAGEKMRLTERGRNAVRDNAARRAQSLLDAVTEVRPYQAIVERVAHRGEFTITATEVAAHWHEHFRSEVSDNDKILNDQAVCFFQLAEGADLGALTIGRRGQPTRFDFDEGNARSFAAGALPPPEPTDATDEARVEPDASETSQSRGGAITTLEKPPKSDIRVFITHGKSLKILNQVKEIVAFGKFEPVVAQERETPAKPVPDKVMDEMRGCGAAVIHVGVEGVLLDSAGSEVPQINGNVLIEIGAAMALYGRSFILLVEEGVTLPSNLQGLYECRYSGDELNGEATMKLLKAFNEFRFS